MATTKKMHVERGRPQYPRKRGSAEYSSLRIPCTDHTSHVSPDRITRHASPNRNGSEQDLEQEVIPRIPQPYRTSFSAITSPVRIQRRTSSGGSSGSLPSSPLHKGPLRATMPVRMASPEHFHHPRMISPDRYSARFYSVSSQGSFRSRSPSGSPARSASRSKCQLSEDGLVNGQINAASSDSVFDESKSSETIHLSLPNGDATVKEFMSSSEDVTPSTTSVNVEGQVIIKKLIEKEYVHIADVSFFKSMDKAGKAELPSMDQISYDLGNSRIGQSEPNSPAQGSPRSRSSTLPSESFVGKPITSTPVKKSLSTSITNFFKKMSPKSLRKLSRASDKGKYTESPHSSSNSLFDNESGSVGSDSPATPTHKSKKSGKFSKLMNSAKKPKESTDISAKQSVNSVISKNDSSSNKDVSKTTNVVLPSSDNHDPALSPQSLPGDSRRILRSIEDNTQAVNEKTVYHTFKEKQSPKRVVGEALSLKPQALKAVEFPDQLLQVDGTVDKHTKMESPKGSSLPGTLDRKSNDKEKLDDSVLTLSKLDDSVVAFPRLNESSALTIHKQRLGSQNHKIMDPPKSLNVREVAKLSKGTWQWPSASAESLGQCSLDIYSTAGSEPSLTSRNGHRSSVNASKQTLRSQEENVSPLQRNQATTHSSSDVSNQSQASAPVPVDAGAIAVSTSSHSSAEDSSLDTTSKTPSYLKLSCAVSGYNKYSSYGSPKEPSRIRVIKRADQNGSLSSVASDQSTGSDCDQSKNESSKVDPMPINGQTSSCHGNGCEPMVNGTDDGTDEVDSAKLIRNRTEKVVNDDSSNYVTKTNVILEPAVNGLNGNSEFKLDLNETLEIKTLNTPSPGKDGHYYLDVMKKEEGQIRQLINLAEQDLQSPLPEDASGRLRSAIGKASLLVTQKFNQFRGLCEKNLTEDPDDAFPTTPQDLAGFWDMVSLQVADVHSLFVEVDKIRKDGWAVQSPVRSAPSVKASTVKAGTRMKSPRSRDSTQRSAKAQEAAKQREEARKRLMAAKRAGRQRKASQSEEIEIFVPE